MAIRYVHHTGSVREVLQDGESVGFMIKQRRWYGKVQWITFTSRTSIASDIVDSGGFSAAFQELLERHRVIKEASK